MKIIDLTGQTYTGMWNYEAPFPNFEMKEIEQPEWLSCKIYSEQFQGMHSQTGTYLETPAHFLGYEKSYPLIDVGVSNLVDIETYVVKLNLEDLPTIDGRNVITREAMVSKFDESKYKSCKAIIISTGWGKNWKNDNFLNSSPFMKYEAMDFLIEKKPFLLASDSPRWENLKNPEGFFPNFFKSDILLLGPCVNLEKIKNDVVKLTALPIKIEKTCCTPCRVIAKD